MACPENIDPAGYITYLENKVIELTIHTRELKTSSIQMYMRNEDAKASKESNLRKELDITRKNYIDQKNKNAMLKKQIIDLENAKNEIKKKYNSIISDDHLQETIRWQKDVIEILASRGRRWFDKYDLSPDASPKIKALDAWLRSIL
jgi:hypothetical protein